MITDDRDDLMDFAVRTAEAAGEITRTYFGRALVERKGDGTEVTEADRAAERHIRAALEERFPDDGVLGEEGDETVGRSGRRWVVDPIDGTRSFASGVPLYGVLLALEVEGVSVLGCCHLPVLNETLVAATGAGAWRNGDRARVSGCEDLADARLVTSGLEYWRDHGDPDVNAAFGRLVRSTRFTRTWGDCYGYACIACGRADLMADAIPGERWDTAALIPILAEAGARFATPAGGPPTRGKPVLAGNRRMYEASRAFFPEGGTG